MFKRKAAMPIATGKHNLKDVLRAKVATDRVFRNRPW